MVLQGMCVVSVLRFECTVVHNGSCLGRGAGVYFHSLSGTVIPTVRKRSRPLTENGTIHPVHGRGVE